MSIIDRLSAWFDRLHWGWQTALATALLLALLLCYVFDIYLADGFISAIKRGM